MNLSSHIPERDPFAELLCLQIVKTIAIKIIAIFESSIFWDKPACFMVVSFLAYALTL
jgi:hypothetical protein